MTYNGYSSQNAVKPKSVVLVICGLGFFGMLGFCLFDCWVLCWFFPLEPWIP